MHLYCCFLPLRPFLTTLRDPQKKHFFNHISNNLRKDIKINPLQRFYPTFCRLSRNDCMQEKVQENYNRIKEEVKKIVADELERIAGDENLSHLLQQK